MQEPSIQEKLEGQIPFEKRVISHPKLERVFDELQTIIHRPGIVPLIEVVGPTGVGKTTLVKKLYSKIIKEMEEPIQKNPGLIPAILVEAPSPDNGSFHWGDFYERFLEAASEPMIERKSLENLKDGFRSRTTKTSAFAGLRRAVEQCITYRGTKVVIIDEGQHLGKVHNARRLQDQMDTIKSLASLSGVQFVMVGTYELLTLLNQSGQLARRSRCIHFPRYNFDRKDDRQSFLNILSMFETRLPVPAKGILVSNMDYIYERCLGLVGVLKDWLRLACERARGSGTALNRQDLEKTALNNGSLIQMLQEIHEGEGRIESSLSDGEKLREKLGLQKAATSNIHSEPEKPARPRRNVGERTLTRDPVGVTA